MFTGLVEDTGTVERASPGEDCLVLSIRPAGLPIAELSVGESVAIDGICLTVTERAGQAFAVTAVAETLRRTTLGQAGPGRRVNLERALRMGDRLGGHMVQGHVDAVGELTARRAAGDSLEIAVRAPAALLRYVVEKGSIAVDGVSLTVARLLDDDSFAIALIPHTATATTLGEKPVGARVNLEVDMIAKYVERLLGGHRAVPGGESQ
jgi:riboflavin synthase